MLLKKSSNITKLEYLHKSYIYLIKVFRTENAMIDKIAPKINILASSIYKMNPSIL